ncbi:hypothetical protein AB205_0205240 [Aquarana catesbeiana]|uniref:AARP2CN domain-containing protein n=1 Tax=Aquarana catesbeiana TaxID=8400 RepID=A0A2G9QCW5_AQUCT|nr:hypothetical protein AB205_0205240 [Aquarana catesbeiana]
MGDKQAAHRPGAFKQQNKAHKSGRHRGRGAQDRENKVVAVQGMNDIPIKKKTDVKKQLSKVIEKRFPDAKLFHLDTAQEAAILLRQMATQKQRYLAYRNCRSYMLAHKADFQPSDDTGLVGTLKVSGYVRGQELRVNGLIHLVGYGDFQMSQIDAPPDPYRLNDRVRKEKAKKGQDMEIEVCFW